MAGEFRKIYEIQAFDGGLNNKYEPTIIEDNDSPDCANVVFDDLGGVQTRGGSTKLNTAAVGSFVIDGLATTRFNNGNQTMVAWAGGSMYTLNATTFTTVGSAQSVWTAGQQIDTTMYQNLMFIGNGGTTPYKYNGAEFTRHGIPVATAPTSISTSSAGVLSGTYSYKVTYVNSYSAEGNPSSATTVTAFSGPTRILVNGLPVAPTSFGVTARKIYRTVTSGTTYLLLTTISDNTTTVYEDNTADANLGASAPVNNDAPDNYKYIKNFQERLFTVDNDDPMHVKYSEVGEPFYFPVTNFLKVGDGDGEIITGINIHGNSLVVYKTNSVWVIYMPSTDPLDWVRIKTNSKVGGGSHRGVANYDNLQLFLGTHFNKSIGFYAFDGASTNPDGNLTTVTAIRSDSKSDKIEADVFALQSTYLTNTAAIEWKNKIWVAVTYSGIANNRIYQFDYARRGESRASGSWVPFTGLSISCFTLYNNKLYGGSSLANGFVYELDTATYSDDGAAINSYYWSKEFETKEKDWQKDFRFANLLLELLGNWNIRFRYRVNSDGSSGNQVDINTNPGGSLWGTMVWGEDNWGGTMIRQNLRVNLANSTGKRIQFYIDNGNTAGRAFKLVRANFYYNRRGLR